MFSIQKFMMWLALLSMSIQLSLFCANASTISTSTSTDLMRNKRQAFRDWSSKRAEFDNEELADDQIEADNQNNRKKSKSFVACGGKRTGSVSAFPLSASVSPLLSLINSQNAEEYLAPSLKRFRAWGGKKRSEKQTFRTWGGKRASDNVAAILAKLRNWEPYNYE